MAFPSNWPLEVSDAQAESINFDSSNLLTSTTAIAQFSQAVITPSDTPSQNVSSSNPLTATNDFSKTAQFTDIESIRDDLVDSPNFRPFAAIADIVFFADFMGGYLYKHIKTSNILKRIQISGVGVSSSNNDFTVFDGKLYFFSTLSGKKKLMSYDISNGIARQISNMRPGNDDSNGQSRFFSINNKLYFVGIDSNNHNKLFVFNPADGNFGSIKQVSDIISGGNDLIVRPRILGNKVYFQGNTPSGDYKLCVFDPNDGENGTIKQLTNFANNNQETFHEGLSVLGGKLYFNARVSGSNQYSKIFCLDPVNNTIRKVSNIAGNNATDGVYRPVSCEDGKLYFGSYDRGLCSYDPLANSGNGLVTTNLTNLAADFQSVQIYQESYKKRVLFNGRVNGTSGYRTFVYTSADGGAVSNIISIPSNINVTQNTNHVIPYSEGWLLFGAKSSNNLVKYFVLDTGIELPTSGENAPVPAGNGTLVGEISVDPTQNEITVNGEPLPTGSVLRNTTTEQKFLKTDGGTTAYIPIPVTPETEWNLGTSANVAWGILQEK